MEEIFIKGKSNIAVSKNERKYFFRMFNAKLDAKKIKERYNWWAYIKLEEKEQDQSDFTLPYIDRQWTKIWGKVCKMKGQDELIGKDGVFMKMRIGNAINNISVTSVSEDEQFEDALSSPKIERLNKLEKKKEVLEETKIMDKDNANENKKRKFKFEVHGYALGFGLKIIRGRIFG
ncbi:hypothetical protein RhiirC2_793841 [Rhizophagus irregularis]|uniref:Uncharacterized protein n=1 Tax=Rhizophagus irregularis TaxID=588596 RepID=A0A2N1MEP1_9GLOM|nr:hypothetical protein RhiirC2_793841 [Rhizophagus irregularis]